MAKLYFHYASMNAGKSAFLLASANNYFERGMNTLIMKPMIDTRDSPGEVVSRIGLRKEAVIIRPDTDIIKIYKDLLLNKEQPDCIYVDEAQFISKNHVWQLCELADRYDVPVMCYGLRTDFRGELFEGSKALLAVADKISELKGICHCGKKATMVARVDEEGKAVVDGDQIEVGGNDRYVSLCRKHWVDVVGCGY